MERAFLGRLGHWCWGLWVAMGAGVKRARVRRACARARLGVAEVVDIGSSLKKICFGGCDRVVHSDIASTGLVLNRYLKSAA